MIAVGNVVGSNICNTTLVLGAAAIIMPVSANRSVIRRDIPIMIGISFLLILLSANSYISRIEGIMLFAGIIAYILYNYRLWKKGAAGTLVPQATEELIDTKNSGKQAVVNSGLRQGILIVAGIAFVVIGAQVLINSVVVIMEGFGVSEKFIGLTIVAVGTSLPELATSIVAALRKEMDISIGNLIGSNVFNILSVIGAAAAIRPIVIPGGFVGSGMIIDYGVMIIAAVVPWMLMRKDLTVGRPGGAMLLLIYTVYIGYLVYTG